MSRAVATVQRLCSLSQEYTHGFLVYGAILPTNPEREEIKALSGRKGLKPEDRARAQRALRDRKTFDTQVF